MRARGATNNNKASPYHTQRLIVAKLENVNQATRLGACLGGSFGCRQTSYLELTLERGEYAVFAEVDGQDRTQ